MLTGSLVMSWMVKGYEAMNSCTGPGGPGYRHCHCRRLFVHPRSRNSALNARVSKAVIGLPSRPPRPEPDQLAFLAWWTISPLLFDRKPGTAPNDCSIFRVEPIGPSRSGSASRPSAESSSAHRIVHGGVPQDVDARHGDFTLVGVVIEIMAPRLILSVLKRRFDAAVRKGVPDTIDLLVVCSEAGMGLESAVERVAEDMERSNPPMAQTLSTLFNDLRILPNRRDAFEKLGATSDGLHRFGAMVSQSLQYGTPLSQALRSIAEELRRDSMIKLEKKAHAAPALPGLPSPGERTSIARYSAPRLRAFARAPAATAPCRGSRENR